MKGFYQPEGFFAIIFDRRNGYLNIASHIEEADYQYLKKRIQGTVFLANSELNFKQSREPQYSPFTPEKEKLIWGNPTISEGYGIAQLLPNVLTYESFKKGKYTVYVRNFQEYSDETPIVIENGKGDTWIRMVERKIDKESQLRYTRIGARLHEGKAEAEHLKYLASQIKKLSKKIEIEVK